jgi:hypothetical protein
LGSKRVQIDGEIMTHRCPARQVAVAFAFVVVADDDPRARARVRMNVRVAHSRAHEAELFPRQVRR